MVVIIATVVARQAADRWPGRGGRCMSPLTWPGRWHVHACWAAGTAKSELDWSYGACAAAVALALVATGPGAGRRRGERAPLPCQAGPGTRRRGIAAVLSRQIPPGYARRHGRGHGRARWPRSRNPDAGRSAVVMPPGSEACTSARLGFRRASEGPVRVIEVDRTVFGDVPRNQAAQLMPSPSRRISAAVAEPAFPVARKLSAVARASARASALPSSW